MTGPIASTAGQAARKVFRLEWRADRDGVAHAHGSGWTRRTLCGLPAVAPRFAWPAHARCRTCEAVLEALEEA